MLRDRSQRSGQKLADLAAAVVDSHLLLAASAQSTTGHGAPNRAVPDRVAAEPAGS
jgi:hypothetical protein